MLAIMLMLGASSTLFVPRASAAVRHAAPLEATVIYVVRAGDTLNSIAARFGVSPGTLARANGISNPNLIYIGQRLVVPGSAAPAPQPGQLLPRRRPVVASTSSRRATHWARSRRAMAPRWLR